MINCHCEFFLSFLKVDPQSDKQKKQSFRKSTCIEAIEILRKNSQRLIAVSYEIKQIDKDGLTYTYSSSFEKPAVAASKIESFMHNPSLISKENEKNSDNKISER